jgi:hypothetical protein
LFKKPDNSYLLATSYYGGEEEAENGDLRAVSYLHFFEYKKGKWMDVTKAYLPIPFNRYHIYDLPHYGTTIKVSNERNNLIYELQWVNSKFIPRQITQATKKR